MFQVLSLPRTGCIRAVVKEVQGMAIARGKQVPSGSQHPV